MVRPACLASLACSLLLPLPAMSSDLLRQLPPCPAPADVAPDASVEYQPESDGSVAPADVQPRADAQVNMDIPLNIPLSEFSKHPANLSQSWVPVGKAEIRDDKVTGVTVLNQPAGQNASSIGCIPQP